MEHKATLSFSDPSLIDGRTVIGYAAMIGNVDGGRDRIVPGAFRKTIKEHKSRVLHLWQHDMNQPPTAVIHDLQEVKREDLPEDLTARYPEIKGGLRVEREYLPTQRGEEILQGIRLGAIREMSIGYDPIRMDYEEGSDGKMVRNLKELRLWDTSDVTWGMNELTIASSKIMANLSELIPGFGSQPCDLKLYQLASTVQDLLQTDMFEKEGRVLSSSNLARLKAALDTLSEILLLAVPTDPEKSHTREAFEEKVRRLELELQFYT